MKIDKLILVGVGGTGTHLLEPLVRLLAFHPQGCTDVILIDGDTYEEKNLERQLFHKENVGLNKAKAGSFRINFGKINTIPIEGYINRLDFKDVILDGVVQSDKSLLIVLAVDNHATRRDIIQAVDERGLKDFVIISPGNELSTGRVRVYAKKNGEALTCHPFKKYEDIANPKDRIPGGCAEEAPSTPQLITANMGAAWATLMLVQAILDDYPVWEDVVFDVRWMKLVTNGEPVMFEKKTMVTVEPEDEYKPVVVEELKSAEVAT